MNIVEPRPLSLCLSVDYFKGYNDAARKANENKNLIDVKRFKNFIEKLYNQYEYDESIARVSTYLDDFMSMTEEELYEFYFG